MRSGNQVGRRARDRSALSELFRHYVMADIRYGFLVRRSQKEGRGQRRSAQCDQNSHRHTSATLYSGARAATYLAACGRQSRLLGTKNIESANTPAAINVTNVRMGEVSRFIGE